MSTAVGRLYDFPSWRPAYAVDAWAAEILYARLYERRGHAPGRGPDNLLNYVEKLLPEGHAIQAIDSNTPSPRTSAWNSAAARCASTRAKSTSASHV